MIRLARPLALVLAVLACSAPGGSPADRPVEAAAPPPSFVEAPPAMVAPPDAFGAAVVRPPDAELARHYAEKIASDAYQDWMGTGGIPHAPQDLDGERRIRADLARLAAARTAPPGVRPLAIPDVEERLPRIDGRLGPSEWDAALRLAIGTGGAGTTLLVGSDGRMLFLAVDAPEERTEAGFDQFRFYYHVWLDPMIVNERMHLGSGSDLVVIRETRFTWSGPPPRDERERWKRYPVSDWHVTRSAWGRSEMAAHRVYEAALALREIGLHPGVPFAAFVEVETDPETDAGGKFVARRRLGELGSQERPIWLAVAAPARPPLVERADPLPLERE